MVVAVSIPLSSLEIGQLKTAALQGRPEGSEPSETLLGYPRLDYTHSARGTA